MDSTDSFEKRAKVNGVLRQDSYTQGASSSEANLAANLQASTLEPSVAQEPRGPANPQQPLDVADQGPAPTSQQGPPNQDDAQWAVRLQTRNGGVAIIKASPEYRMMQESYHAERRRNGRAQPRPRTPDPYNRKLSKRQWETEVKVWRHAVKKYVA